jgi:hypothetical protein
VSPLRNIPVTEGLGIRDDDIFPGADEDSPLLKLTTSFRFRMFRLGKDEKKALLILLIALFARFSCVTPDGLLD